MKLIECYIENFGKLSDFKYSFSNGLNVIKKDNGYGKTTLSVFIKAMFFGLDESKKIKIEENDRKRYLPWNGAKCAGSLTFESNGQTYRIERTFMPKASDDEFKLYDAKSNKESNAFSKNIGEELFGIDEEGFERTVFLSEANLAGKTENKKIASKLSDLVGCEGDIGVMDDAIALLEKQRKVYFKKGGAGEIRDIKDKLNQTEIKITNLTRMRESLCKEEEKLSGITTELNALYEKKKNIQNEAKLAEIARSKHTYEKQYLEMKKTLEEDEKTYESLKNFFKNGVPSVQEVDGAKELLAKSQRIYEDHERDNPKSTNPDDSFFAKEPAEEEYESAALASKKLKEKYRERDDLKQKLRSQGGGNQNCPEPEEAEKHILNITTASNAKNANKGLRFALFMGMACTLAGLVLAFSVHIACFALSAVGVALLIFTVLQTVACKSKENSHNLFKSAIDFATKYKPGESITESNVLGVLYELKSEAAAHKKALDETASLSAQLSSVCDEISGIERDACEFLAHFPISNEASIYEAVDGILQKHAIHRALRDANLQNEARQKEELVLAKKYSETASAFLSRFPVRSERPFDEINSKIIEYATVRRTLLRTKSSIEEFITEHGIDPENLSCGNFTEYIPNPDDPTLLAKISELEKEKTLIERQCRIYSDEIDKMDELVADCQMYSETVKKYERLLDINLKTQKFLFEAKDNLTARYLSKTKSAFDRYVSIITGESPDDFKMDTSFAVMKSERGALKSTAAYSRGTRDTYFLATRLALVDSLYENEAPFIILDDPFAYFDDTRLSHSLSAIQKLAKERQIIYFTCQDARKP